MFFCKESLALVFNVARRFSLWHLSSVSF